MDRRVTRCGGPIPVGPIARGWLGVVGCMMLAGCGSHRSGVATTATIAPPAADWRDVATTADRARLRGWRGAWIDALAHVDARAIAADPALFDPDRALSKPLPPAGDYRCRTVKLGARGRSTGPAFTAYGWFACRIEGDQGGGISFAKLSGSQRPVGMVFADTDARGVFLGTLELGDEQRAMRYGRDGGRDMVGVVERIDARRWRIVLPYPQFESLLDVVELVPAS